MSWNDITYRQFEKFKNISEIEDDNEKTIAIAQGIYGDDVINKPISEFRELCKNLTFISEEVPTSIKVKNVKVNGREYYFDGLLGNISTAQYVDFQNYMKNEDEAKSFSVFFIPKGHKYNDGYDMTQVFEDIKDMPMPVLMSASFFFVRQWETFIRIFQRSSIQQIQNLNLPKEMKKHIKQIVTNSANLASYHTYLNSVK